jgi:hypothetical protein
MANGNLPQGGSDNAVRDYRRWVDSNLEKAEYTQIAFEAFGGVGYSDETLKYFAYAAHAVQDNDSPEHTGYQPWYGVFTLDVVNHYLGERKSALGKAAADAEALYQSQVDTAFLWDRFQIELKEKEKQIDLQKK